MTPSEITLRKNSRLLVVSFEDGMEFNLSFEYLRVHSPSAEVVGHGPGQETLQTGKENVGITRIDPVGHYAIRLVFDASNDTVSSSRSITVCKRRAPIFSVFSFT